MQGRKVITTNHSSSEMLAILVQGYYDIRFGRGIPKEYETWPDLKQRQYELGRNTGTVIKAAGLKLPTFPVFGSKGWYPPAVIEAYQLAHSKLPNRHLPNFPATNETTEKGATK